MRYYFTCLPFSCSNPLSISVVVRHTQTCCIYICPLSNIELFGWPIRFFLSHSFFNPTYLNFQDFVYIFFTTVAVVSVFTMPSRSPQSSINFACATIKKKYCREIPHIQNAPRLLKLVIYPIRVPLQMAIPYVRLLAHCVGISGFTQQYDQIVC